MALLFNRGSGNTANGVAALYNNATGDNNTANGQRALYDNLSGSRNTANGDGALSNNTTGNSNTADGFQALGANTTGSYNIALAEMQVATLQRLMTYLHRDAGREREPQLLYRQHFQSTSSFRPGSLRQFGWQAGDDYVVQAV
jgi:hypothetical protein